MRSRDSQTYLRARENLSRHDGRYLQNAPAIDNDRRHARRSCYIEFLSYSARITGSIWFPNGRIRANFLCPRCTDPVHANWVNKFNLAPFTDIYFKFIATSLNLCHKHLKSNVSQFLILFFYIILSIFFFNQSWSCLYQLIRFWIGLSDNTHDLSKKKNENAQLMNVRRIVARVKYVKSLFLLSLSTMA